MKEVHTLYKLIVLYLLNRIMFSLNNGQLCAFMAEEQYTDYFTLQETLVDMVDSGLLVTDIIRNNTYYSLTESGKSTLEFFEQDIPTAIRRDIEVPVKKNRFQLREENAVIADYSRQPGEKEFTVSLQVKEKEDVLISLKLPVPEEQQAIRMCDNWQKKSSEIYQYLMQELLG